MADVRLWFVKLYSVMCLYVYWHVYSYVNIYLHVFIYLLLERHATTSVTQRLLEKALSAELGTSDQLCSRSTRVTLLYFECFCGIWIIGMKFGINYARQLLIWN